MSTQDTPTKPSMETLERRASVRARQSWQPHPDLVLEAQRTLEFYGGHPGPEEYDSMRRVVVAVLGWQERHDAAERAHAKRRDDSFRAAEALRIVEQVQAHRKVAPIQNPCAACDGRGGFVTFGAAEDEHDGGAECPDCGGAGVIQ